MTVHVVRGDGFRVHLQPSAGERWAPPVVTGGDVGVYMAGLRLDEQVTDAFFQARSASTNEIATQTDQPCLHAAPACAVGTRSFSLTVIVDDAPTPSSYPDPPALPHRTVDNAVELDPSNTEGVFSVEQGHRVSVRMPGSHQVSVPEGLFLDRWYLDRTATQVALLAVRTTGIVEVNAYGRVPCTHDEPPCYAVIPRHPWTVAVGPAGSTAHGVTAELDYRVVTAGNSPMLTTQLRRSDGTPAFGAVDLYARQYGEQAYRRIGVAVTRADGSLDVVVRPTLQTAYVAVVRNPIGRLSSVSSVVQVHARINVDHPDANSSVAGSAVTFTGSLVPGRSSVPVGMGEQTSTGFRYLTQGATGADGRFAISVRRLTSGWHTFVAYTSARAGTLRGSTRVSVHVG